MTDLYLAKIAQLSFFESTVKVFNNHVRVQGT
jgi:hypothetical protein